MCCCLRMDEQSVPEREFGDGMAVNRAESAVWDQ